LVKYHFQQLFLASLFHHFYDQLEAFIASMIHHTHRNIQEKDIHSIAVIMELITFHLMDALKKKITIPSKFD